MTNWASCEGFYRARQSPFENAMMPLQKLLAWTIRFICRKYGERSAVEGIIISAVLKFLTNSAAHFDSEIKCDREVAEIK